MVASSPFFLVFRSIHIVTGALWFGSAFLFSLFVGPAAAKVGPASVPLMHVIVKERKIATVITGLAITAVTAGWIMWLYHANQAGLSTYWDLTEAKVLFLGGVLATVAMFEGLHGVGNNVEKLVGLGDEVAASGAPPSAEQGAEMQRLGAAIEKASKIDLLLLFLVVLCMATARYW
ncbi:MAG: hypothetical protein ABJB55_07375 [Actinomycetota bacterium]